MMLRVANELFFSALVALLLVWTLLLKEANAYRRSTWDGVPGSIQSCENLRIGRDDFEGTLTLLRSIYCEPPLVLHVKGDAVLQSIGIFLTTNLYFVVHRGGTLTLSGDSIDIRREASDWSLLHVLGDVEFHARQWTPSHQDGATSGDGGGLLQLFEGGRVLSKQNIAYTTDSILVADTNKMNKPRVILLNPPVKPTRDLSNSAYMGAFDTGVYGNGPARPPPRRVQLPSALFSLLDDDPGTVDPDRSLSVGSVLEGTLLAPDGDSALWLGVDGSIMFGRMPISSPELAAREGKLWWTTSKLVASDFDKVRQAFNRRAMLAHWSASEQAKEGGKGVPVEVGSGGAVDEEDGEDSWDSWQRGSRVSNANPKKSARDSKRLQVRMTVDNRGRVEVKVDGVCVLRISGSRPYEWMHRFPFQWRTRSDDYRVVTTATGMEVRLGDKVVWGVTADDDK